MKCKFVGSDGLCPRSPCRNMEYEIYGMDASDELNSGSKLLICMVGVSGCGKTCVILKILLIFLDL